jgi:hypothetical protein
MISIAPLVPRSLESGVPSSSPVEELNVAQLGALVTSNESAPPCGFETEGTYRYSAPTSTVVDGVLLITGGAMVLMVLVASVAPVVPLPLPPHAVSVATMIAHHAK